MNLRPVTDDEWGQMGAMLSHYGCPPGFLQRETVVIREGRYREAFTASPLLLSLADALPEPPLSLGMKAGEFSKGSFRPSLELGTVLYPLATENTIALGDEHMMRFLYGRDIFKEHLPPGLTLGRKLVGTQDGEFLGFGIYNGRTLANVIDKGAYLRQFQ
jgi:ribosome biogenesis protein Nip4